MKSTFRGDNQLKEPLFYFFLLFMLFFVFSQVHFLNKALILCDALLVVPIFQCTFLSFSTTGGLIYYQEYLEFKAYNWFGLLFGVSLILSGVYTLCFRNFSSFEVEVVQTTQEPSNSPSVSPPRDHDNLLPPPDAPVVVPPPSENTAPEVPPPASPTSMYRLRSGHRRNGSNMIPVADPLFMPAVAVQGIPFWPDSEVPRAGEDNNDPPAQDMSPGLAEEVIVPGASNAKAQMTLYE